MCAHPRPHWPDSDVYKLGIFSATWNEPSNPRGFIRASSPPRSVGNPRKRGRHRIEVIITPPSSSLSGCGARSWRKLARLLATVVVGEKAELVFFIRAMRRAAPTPRSVRVAVAMQRPAGMTFITLAGRCLRRSVAQAGPRRESDSVRRWRPYAIKFISRRRLCWRRQRRLS